MNSIPFDAFEVAVLLGTALQIADVPYAIGGAIAYGIWGDPRGTHDVDINLFVGHEAIDHALTVLEDAGVCLDRDQAHKADLEGDVIIGTYNGMRVDIFTPSIPFSWEAAKTRVEVTGPLGVAFYLSPEATAVFKLLFYRTKDLVDLEKLVRVQGEDLNQAYIRRWVVEMMGEDDERVESWDEICKRSRPVRPSPTTEPHLGVDE